MLGSRNRNTPGAVPPLEKKKDKFKELGKGWELSQPQGQQLTWRARGLHREPPRQMAWGPRPGTAASSPRWNERTSRRMKPCRQLRSSSRQCPAFTQFLYSAQLRRTASSDSTMSQPRAEKGGGPGSSTHARREPWEVPTARKRWRSFQAAQAQPHPETIPNHWCCLASLNTTIQFVTDGRGGPFFHIREAAAPPLLKGTT